MENKDTYSNYYGLLFECPMGREVSRCVFRDVRKINITDRLEFIKNLSFIEKTELIQAHQKCLAKREEKIPYSRIAVL